MTEIYMNLKLIYRTLKIIKLHLRFLWFCYGFMKHLFVS